MAKEALVEELQTWLAAEDFTPNRDRIEQLTESFKQLRAAVLAVQQEAHAAGETADQPFEYTQDAEDIRFAELLTTYHDRRKAADKLRTEQERSNLAEKKALVEEMQSLIQDEENIGKAYKRFNAIKQKWNEIGPVPNSDRRDLQADYSRLIELFYYNINIYRELQINDLKKNQELKLKVIEEIKLLENEKSIHQVDFLIHKYLQEWDELGPTFQEEWAKIREEFKVQVGKVFERIRAHRNEVKQEHQQHLEAKQALVTKVEEIAAKEIVDPAEMQAAGREVLEYQKQWKKLGYAGRGKNDKIWNQFRAACDTFFAKRDQLMADSNQEFSKIRTEKAALIERAKAIYQGEDGNAIAAELKTLQRKWKESGKLMPSEEFKLFKEFRKYCDSFFDRKKKEGEAQIKAEKAANQAKQAFLTSMNTLIQEGIKEKGEAQITEWREQWNQMADVSGKIKDKVNAAFEDGLVKAYKSLGISQEVLEEKAFDSKIEMLTDAKEGDEGLKLERSAINQKIRDVQTQLAQEESKLDFFKYSKDDNPLKKELMNRIDAVKADITALKDKKKRIDLALKGLQKSEAEKIEGEEAKA